MATLHRRYKYHGIYLIIFVALMNATTVGRGLKQAKNNFPNMFFFLCYLLCQYEIYFSLSHLVRLKVCVVINFAIHGL